MNNYLLASTAHLCVSGGHVVILDLISGKYLGVPTIEAARLGGWVRGWPIAAACGRDTASNPPEVLERLRDQGLLTTDPSLGKSAEPVMREIRDTWYAALWPRVAKPIRLRHLVRMVWAVLFAVGAMRWLRLDRIIRRAQRRKLYSAPARIDTERVAALLQIYRGLRPFFYSTEQRCMFHCMALAEFLAGFGVYPDWVFGVRIAPFQAHCWLELDGVSLTDPPLTLDRMTPIMAV
jgi:hypothetical protein